jgi:hypothetical protein
MPKFLENKLKREYGENSAVPFKVMNSIGAMKGNKETEKGREMEKKHEEDKTMKKATVEHEPMREMRIEIHRGPKNKVTGFTVHHHMMPKASKSMAFSENTTHSHPFGVGEHEAMMDHIHEHTAAQMGGEAAMPKGEAAEEEAEGE